MKHPQPKSKQYFLRFQGPSGIAAAQLSSYLLPCLLDLEATSRRSTYRLTIQLQECTEKEPTPPRKPKSTYKRKPLPPMVLM